LAPSGVHPGSLSFVWSIPVDGQAATRSSCRGFGRR
jgi:hypothetical protein